MRLLITNPDRFAAEFNRKFPGAYRKVDAVDIRYMTECGFIGRYRGYSMRLDLDTVRRLLQLEHLQQNRQKREEIKDSDGAIHCKRCHVVLADQPDGEVGRPKEYCEDCEASRSRVRYLKWKEEHKADRM